MSSRLEGALFSEESLRGFLEGRLQAMLSAIEQYDQGKLLNSNPDDLATYFAASYTVAPPVIIEAGIGVSEAETKVDVRNRFDYGDWLGEQSVVPGTRLTLHIPFEGDPAVLRFKASTFNYGFPRAQVVGSEIRLSYSAPQRSLAGAKPYFDEQLSNLRQHLGWSTADLEVSNRRLLPAAKAAIDARRNRVLEGKNLAASLGFPLRARPDAPKTYSLPEVRRKVPLPPPSATAPFAPEPALDDATYDQVLTVLGNMVRVMEQSPSAFSGMGEEDLRTHFLVQLNGQFEGKASAETFRGMGKTDILLQEANKSVFVAECKFWKGPASLIKAIDQLLGYLTWRDAKCAVLVFSRGGVFSSVLEQVRKTLSEHPQVVGPVEQFGESAFRVRLRQKEDPSRTITCTVLVYNVPAAPEDRSSKAPPAKPKSR